jgi:acetamidase/formamidase
MVDHLAEEYDLSREDAYVLSSLCVDLRISEVVDAGHTSSARCFRSLSSRHVVDRHPSPK